MKSKKDMAATQAAKKEATVAEITSLCSELSRNMTATADQLLANYEGREEKLLKLLKRLKSSLCCGNAIEALLGEKSTKNWWSRGFHYEKAKALYSFLVRCNIPKLMGLIRSRKWQASVHVMIEHMSFLSSKGLESYFALIDTKLTFYGFASRIRDEYQIRPSRAEALLIKAADNSMTNEPVDWERAFRTVMKVLLRNPTGTLISDASIAAAAVGGRMCDKGRGKYITSMNNTTLPSTEVNMLECQCCFDEHNKADMVRCCSGKHLFCKMCLQMHTSTRIDVGNFGVMPNAVTYVGLSCKKCHKLADTSAVDKVKVVNAGKRAASAVLKNGTVVDVEPLLKDPPPVRR